MRRRTHRREPRLVRASRLATIAAAAIFGVLAPAARAAGLGSDGAAAIAACALGQNEPGVRKIVTKLEFQGTKEVKEPAIRVKIKTHEGGEYDEQVLDQDVRSLYDNFHFADVKVFSEAFEGGRKVVFRVVESPLITTVKFKGLDDLSEKDLDEVVDVKKGQFLSEEILDEQAREIQRFYRHKGYHFAEVDYRLDPNKVRKGYDVTFDVVEGPKVTVNDLVFVGNKSLTSDQIEDVMETKESSLFTKGLFEERTLQQDVIAVKTAFRGQGYRDVSVRIERIDFSADKSSVSIRLAIVEGPRYFVRSVGISGNAVFSDAEVMAKVKLKAGQPYLFDRRDGDERAIRDLYLDNAYVEAQINTKETFGQTTNDVDVVYQIKEGKKYKVGDVKITGNRLTKDKVIRRELSFYPGEPVNIGEIRKSFYRLLALGYFDIEGGLKFDPELNVDEGLQDWTLAVKEGRTGNLRFAAGIGSDSGLIGQISVTKKNFDIADLPDGFSDLINGEAFTGAGQTIFLDIAPGTEVSQIGVGFREPHIADTDNSFGVDIFRRFRNRSAYDETRTGFELTVGRYLEKFSRDIAVEVHLRNEQVKISNIDDDLDRICSVHGDRIDDCNAAGLNRVVAIGPSLTWRTIDNPLSPTDGYDLGLSYEFGGGPLGGNTDMNRAVADAARYFPVYEQEDELRHVLAARFHLGWESGFGDTTTVPIYERFFAGGRSSLRGFQFRGAGPHKKGEAVGGQGIATGSFEYSIPIYQEIFRGVLFTDYGTVNDTFGRLSLDTLRVSVGFGVRFRVPFLGPVPFAFDFGFPLRDEPDDERQVVSFSLGEVFF
jgi:outer membrane protein insertion porin family